MRISFILPLLGALLPVVQAIPPPDNFCKPGVQRCDEYNSIQYCNELGLWKTETCASGKTCDLMSNACLSPQEHRCKSDSWRCREDKIQKCVDEKWVTSKTCDKGDICDMSGRGSSVPHCRKTLSTVPRGELYEECKPGHRTCDADRYTLRICGSHCTWELEKKCTTPGDCRIDGPGEAHCDRGGIDPPRRQKTRDLHVPKPCNPGDRNCHGNLQTIMICNNQGVWVPEKNCPAPGDCKNDDPNQAHCKNTPPKEPNMSRDEPLCQVGARVCDKERRFVFECDKTGHWDEPTQCFRDGFCQQNRYGELTCGGFPLYDGINDICNSHCESMSYLYCAAGDRSPEKWESCRQSMCREKRCKGCDRCHYQKPYGGVKPDLSTLVPPPKKGGL